MECWKHNLGMIKGSLFLCTSLSPTKLMILRWGVIFVGSSAIISSIIADKGSQYCDFGIMELLSPVIIQDARLIIVDALL